MNTSLAQGVVFVSAWGRLVETFLPVCCECKTGSPPRCLNHNVEHKMNGPSFSPFKLVLVSGSEIAELILD